MFEKLCKVCAYRKGYNTCCNGCKYCNNINNLSQCCHCDEEVDEVEENDICYYFRYLAR